MGLCKKPFCSVYDVKTWDWIQIRINSWGAPDIWPFSISGIRPDTGFLFAGYPAWPDTGYPAYSFFPSRKNYFFAISWINSSQISGIRPNIRPDIRYLAKPDIRYPAKLTAGYPAGRISGKSISGAPLIHIRIVKVEKTRIQDHILPSGATWWSTSWRRWGGRWRNRSRRRTTLAR